jgi:hypothetical protein
VMTGMVTGIVLCLDFEMNAYRLSKIQHYTLIYVTTPIHFCRSVRLIRALCYKGPMWMIVGIFNLERNGLESLRRGMGVINLLA